MLCSICKRSDPKIFFKKYDYETKSKMIEFYHEHCATFLMQSRKGSQTDCKPPFKIIFKEYVPKVCCICRSYCGSHLFKCAKQQCKFSCHVSCAADNLFEFFLIVKDNGDLKHAFHCNNHRTVKGIASFKPVDPNKRFKM